MPDSIIKKKSYEFSIKIIKLYKKIVDMDKEYILSRQFLRSGTSIGANVSEAVRGCSRSDFRNKLYISLKESEETVYWINLLTDTDFITKEEADDLIKDCNELISMLVSSLKTIDSKQNTKTSY